MTRSHSADPVLVTGATGKQGGAVARKLLAQGTPVRALVRDPQSSNAVALAALGAAVVQGDLNDPGSLQAACLGAKAVFSIQTPDLKALSADTERVQGLNLVEAARAANVPQFIHSSVSGAGDYHRNAPGWKEGRWNTHYWESKAYTQELVGDAGFTYWTIIKPGFFMENFVRPSFFYANWTENRFLTVIAPETRPALVAVQDIGTVAAAAMSDPKKFDRVSLELAGELLTMRKIAAVLSEVWGEPIEAPSYTPSQALAQGLLPAFVNSQERLNEVGSPATPDQARGLGLQTTSFRAWAESHKPVKTTLLQEPA